jgi:hypothetical protein
LSVGDQTALRMQVKLGIGKEDPDLRLVVETLA